MLLQIMEEGHLTDSFGRKVDFKNAILIMTTNVGAKSIASRGFGFESSSSEEAGYEKMKKDVLAEISRVFKPEFIGRLDEVIVFHKLTDDDMKHIIDIELHKVRERMSERGLKLVLDDSAKQLIIDKSRDEGEREHTDYGARPLRRAVEMYIEDPLAEELLRGEFDGKNMINVTVKEVGDERSLHFTGVYEETSEPEQELATVGTPAEAEAESGESE
jgi:ATP-dependent Clp protease ATP-binding subunit ClpC